jgi:hypothetical protein
MQVWGLQDLTWLHTIEILSLQGLTQHQAATKRNDIQEKAIAFAVFIRPGCADARPDFFASFVVGRLLSF